VQGGGTDRVEREATEGGNGKGGLQVERAKKKGEPSTSGGYLPKKTGFGG